jgi:hypothetical protein
VVEVPIPNDDFGDVFGGDACVVLEKNDSGTKVFLGGLSKFPPLQVPSSSSKGAVPNPVFVTVTVQPRPMLARPPFFFAASPPPPVQLAVAWPVGVLPFAQRRPESLVIPTLVGTKHAYERPKMQIAQDKDYAIVLRSPKICWHAVMHVSDARLSQNVTMTLIRNSFTRVTSIHS